MDEVTHTLLEQPNGGFGGLGSGFIGGIIGGMLFGNGGYGFGGGANRGAIGYDTGDDSLQNIVDICSALLAYKVLQNK